MGAAEVAVQLYWVDRIESTLVASLMAPLTRNSVGSISKELANLFEPKKIQKVVLDCEKCTDQVNVGLISLVANIRQMLRQTSAKFFISGATADIMSFLKKSGVSDDIQYINSFKEINGPVPAKPKLDVNFINPFISATRETIGSMCSLSIEVGSPVPRKLAGQRHYDLAALVVLKGEEFSGAVIIGFDKASYLKVLGCMLGEEVDGDIRELADGASELLNIIYGNAKKTLNTHGFGFKTAIPTVAHDYTPPEHGIGIVIPMIFNGGKITMEVVSST